MLDKQGLRTFVLGGIAGALAGILLAPKSGKELRGSIASRAGEAREQGRETYFEAQERMQEHLARARERYPYSKEVLAGEAAEDSLSKRGSQAAPGSLPDPSFLTETSADALSGSSSLRDASQSASRSSFRENPDPEEIRRKIQEARSRLQAQLNDPRPENTFGNPHE